MQHRLAGLVREVQRLRIEIVLSFLNFQYLLKTKKYYSILILIMAGRPQTACRIQARLISIKQRTFADK